MHNGQILTGHVIQIGDYYSLQNSGISLHLIISVMYFKIISFCSIIASAASLTTFAVMGKMGIAISFASAYVYTVELFPTPLRNIGIGSASMSARVSGMIAPFMGDLASGK